ncbi:MAG TPA: hypothetical protein VFJ18_13020 [Pararhizobium sp.]|nr:hypothetical protein [Pararhizobium sp.]
MARANRQSVLRFSHRARPSPPGNQPPVKTDTLLKLTVAGLLVGVAAGCAVAGGGRRPSRGSRLAAYGAALMAASVVADSAMEHYRGNYKKGAMNVAPIAALITMATAITAALSRKATFFKSAIFGGAITTGLFGLGFHFKNILERPGGLSFNNLFYRAPFGAPGAMILAGAAGLCSVKAATADDRHLFGSGPGGERAGRSMGIVTAVGLFGLTAEIGLLHFRGSFQNKLMYVPVVAVPLTGVAMTAATASRSPTARVLARNMLVGTMTLGVVGTGLHSYGVSRGMGGYANWMQNLFQGPPIPAPPSLAGIGLMGLSALDLLGRKGGRPRRG